MTLIGRDEKRLARTAADLKVRAPNSEVKIITADFCSAQSIQDVTKKVFESGYIDLVLIAHGFLPNQSLCQEELSFCRQALEINGISPVLFAEAFAQEMQRAGQGTIVLFGSVAGDRGRKSNYVYGAAKGLVARYAQGLQHRFAGTGITVVLVKPGPTDTRMTAYLKLAGAKLAPVDDVAKYIVRGISSGMHIIYAPPVWKFIMMVIQHLPRSIFNRMNV